jgi:hypothetical protein
VVIDPEPVGLGHLLDEPAHEQQGGHLGQEEGHRDPAPLLIGGPREERLRIVGAGVVEQTGWQQRQRQNDKGEQLDQPGVYLFQFRPTFRGGYRQLA